MRVLLHPPFGIGDSRATQQRQCPVAGLAPRHADVQYERLGDLVADRDVRRQRGHRVLEHHPHFQTSYPIELRRGPAHQLGRAEGGAPAHRAVGCQKAHRPQECLALPGARFSNDAQTLTRSHAQ